LGFFFWREGDFEGKKRLPSLEILATVIFLLRVRLSFRNSEAMALSAAGAGGDLGDYLRALDGLDDVLESPRAQGTTKTTTSAPAAGMAYCTPERLTQCADDLADALPQVLTLVGGDHSGARHETEQVRNAITLLEGLGEIDGAVAACNLLQRLVQACVVPGGAGAHAGAIGTAGGDGLLDPAESLQRMRSDAENLRGERDRFRDEAEETRRSVRALKEQLRLAKAEHTQELATMRRERDAARRKVAGFSKREEQFGVEIRRHEQQYEKLRLRVQDLLAGRPDPAPGRGAARSSGPSGAAVAALKKKHAREVEALLEENDEIRQAFETLEQDMDAALSEREELLGRIEVLESSEAGGQDHGAPPSPSRSDATAGPQAPSTPARKQWRIAAGDIDLPDHSTTPSPKVAPVFAVHNTENTPTN
jgi:Afadin- and alpha -actinin-Binding